LHEPQRGLKKERRTMKKEMVLLTVVVMAIVSISAITPSYAFNPQPEPPGIWASIYEDLRSLNQELSPALAKLADAKPGANLTKLGLLKSHGNMMNLLQSLRTKVKGLEGTKGQEKGVLDICNKMKPKLDNLGLFLKNFKLAIQQGDKPTAQGLLNQMGETVKGLEALIAK
jgi:hypothetical protein